MSINPKAPRGPQPAATRHRALILAIAAMSGAVTGYYAADWQAGTTVFAAVIAALTIDTGD